MQEQVSDGDVLLPIGRELLSQQGGITHLHIYAQWRLNVNNKDLFLLLLLQDNSCLGVVTSSIIILKISFVLL